MPTNHLNAYHNLHRSHAPRGNASTDALRPTVFLREKVWPLERNSTRSVEGSIPTGTVGTIIKLLLLRQEMFFIYRLTVRRFPINKLPKVEAASCRFKRLEAASTWYKHFCKSPKYVGAKNQAYQCWLRDRFLFTCHPIR